MSATNVENQKPEFSAAATPQERVLAKWNSIVEKYSDMGEDSIYAAFSRVGTNNADLSPLQHGRVQKINPLPADYTKSELGEFLRNPTTSEKPLQQISQGLRWTAYPYQKILKSYADMLTYRHYVFPQNVEKEDVLSKEFKREWRLVDQAEKKFGFEELGHQATGQAMATAKVFYVSRYSIDKSHNKVDYIFHQQLPSDWCQIIGYNNISKYTVSFNMMYFLQMGTDYRQFGDLFEPYIYDFNDIFERGDRKEKGSKYIYATKADGREYRFDFDRVKHNAAGNPEMFMQNGRWYYYVSLPIDRVWTFEIDDTTPTCVPILSGLLQTFEQQSDYEAAQLSLIMNPLIKIFTGEIPYNTGDVAKREDDYKLSLGGRALFESYWNNLMRTTNTSGTAFFMAPAENIKSHDYAESANANELSSSFNSYAMGKSGLTALIPIEESPSGTVSEYSSKLESRFADRVYVTLKKMFETMLSKWNLKWDWTVTIFGSIYNDEMSKSMAYKSLDKGDQYQWYILSALDNTTILDKLSGVAVLKESGFIDGLMPPQTSYTQAKSGGNTDGSSAGNHGTSAEGAPTKDKTEVTDTEREKKTEIAGEA